MSVLFPFVYGFLIEAACVFWMRYSERGAPARAAFFAMVIGASYLLGIETSLGAWAHKIAFILGYGAGTYVTVRWMPTKKPEFCARRPFEVDSGP